jgi:hypothetical protein
MGFKLCTFEVDMHKNGPNPNIRKHLLWEHNWENIDFSQLATIVIERVIER